MNEIRTAQEYKEKIELRESTERGIEIAKQQILKLSEQISEEWKYIHEMTEILDELNNALLGYKLKQELMTSPTAVNIEKDKMHQGEFKCEDWRNEVVEDCEGKNCPLHTRDLMCCPPLVDGVQCDCLSWGKQCNTCTHNPRGWKEGQNYLSYVVEGSDE